MPKAGGWIGVGRDNNKGGVGKGEEWGEGGEECVVLDSREHRKQSSNTKPMGKQGMHTSSSK
jgi:hypothetical protein